MPDVELRNAPPGVQGKNSYWQPAARRRPGEYVPRRDAGSEELSRTILEIEDVVKALVAEIEAMRDYRRSLVGRQHVTDGHRGEVAEAIRRSTHDMEDLILLREQIAARNELVKARESEAESRIWQHVAAFQADVAALAAEVDGYNVHAAAAAGFLRKAHALAQKRMVLDRHLENEAMRGNFMAFDLGAAMAGIDEAFIPAVGGGEPHFDGRREHHSRTLNGPFKVLYLWSRR